MNDYFIIQHYSYLVCSHPLYGRCNGFIKSSSGSLFKEGSSFAVKLQFYLVMGTVCGYLSVFYVTSVYYQTAVSQYEFELSSLAHCLYRLICVFCSRYLHSYSVAAFYGDRRLCDSHLIDAIIYDGSGLLHETSEFFSFKICLGFHYYIYASVYIETIL